MTCPRSTPPSASPPAPTPKVRARAGPLPWPVGDVLALPYAAAIALRNRRFDAGRNVTRLDLPVVSVGNLSVGGTGKTPVVREVVRWLREAGVRAVVAMRGYRGAGGTSDEAEEYRAAFRDERAEDARAAPMVAVNPDRVAGVAAARLRAEAEGRPLGAVVLDDGFQHRRVHRDVDVVLIDATRSPFPDARGRCGPEARPLPSGWLREPASSLRRAHAVVLTRCDEATPAEVDALERRVRAALPSGALAARATHSWRGVRVGNERETHPLELLAGLKAVAVCAIGNPGPFLAAAERAVGAPLAGAIVLRDHDHYKAAVLARIIDAAQRAQASAIITTEKDWVKLDTVPPGTWPCPVIRPVLGIDFLAGGDDLCRRILAACDAIDPATDGDDADAQHDAARSGTPAPVASPRG